MLRQRTRRKAHAQRGARQAASWLLAAALSLLATTARAESPSIDVRAWRPSTDPQASMVLEPVATPGRWETNVGLNLSYAEAPVRSPSGIVGRPLARTLDAAVVAGLGLGSSCAVGVTVPFFLWQEGATGLPTTVVQGGSVPKSGVGDPSLVAKATLITNERRGLVSGFGLAAVAEVGLPLGNREGFMGEGAVTSTVRALGEFALPIAAVRATFGYALRTQWRSWPDDPNATRFGDTLPWSIGFTLRPKAVVPALDADDRQTWELAWHGALPAGPVAPFAPGAAVVSPALMGVDDRVTLGHRRELYLVAGLDVGLDAAVGVPSVSFVASIGWAPRRHDRDGDGVDDDTDQCPDLPEDRDGIQDDDGCPEDDADSDDVPDTEDACPLVPGVASADPKRNGCPAPGAAPAKPAGP